MEPIFDDTEFEPAVLPSRLPNLLLNGSDGIAVGMATKIPPHNLNEVAAAIKFHVEKVIEQNRKIGLDNPPKIDALEYMDFLKGPDFPTGATIHGIDGIVDMYRTGNGRFHIRSDVEVLDDSSGKRLIVHSIPYQVKKAGMLQGIAELVQKEAVGTEPQGRKFLYRPLIARSEYVGVESRRLVNRLFGGRAAPLFAQLAESEALTDDDLTEIEALLREMRK